MVATRQELRSCCDTCATFWHDQLATKQLINYSTVSAGCLVQSFFTAHCGGCRLGMITKTGVIGHTIFNLHVHVTHCRCQRQSFDLVLCCALHVKPVASLTATPRAVQFTSI